MKTITWEKKSQVCRFSEDNVGGTVVLLVNTLSLRRDCTRQLPAKAALFLPQGHPPVSIQGATLPGTACIYQTRNFFSGYLKLLKKKKKEQKSACAHTYTHS